MPDYDYYHNAPTISNKTANRLCRLVILITFMKRYWVCKIVPCRQMHFVITKYFVRLYMLLKLCVKNVKPK